MQAGTSRVQARMAYDMSFLAGKRGEWWINTTITYNAIRKHTPYRNNLHALAILSLWKGWYSAYRHFWNHRLKNLLMEAFSNTIRF